MNQFFCLINELKFLGLKFVQMQKNQSFHTVLNCSPFKARFGHEPKQTLQVNVVPPAINSLMKFAFCSSFNYEELEKSDEAIEEDEFSSVTHKRKRRTRATNCSDSLSLSEDESLTPNIPLTRRRKRVLFLIEDRDHQVEPSNENEIHSHNSPGDDCFLNQNGDDNDGQHTDTIGSDQLFTSDDDQFAMLSECSNNNSNDDLNQNISASLNQNGPFCCVCKNPAGGAHTCVKCHSNVHPFCGEGSEGYGSKLTCNLCLKSEKFEVLKESIRSNTKNKRLKWWNKLQNDVLW